MGSLTKRLPIAQYKLPSTLLSAHELPRNRYYKRVGRNHDIEVETTSLSQYIERGLGYITENLDFGIIVPLPDYAAGTLFQIRRSGYADS